MVLCSLQARMPSTGLHREAEEKAEAERAAAEREATEKAAAEGARPASAPDAADSGDESGPPLYMPSQRKSGEHGAIPSVAAPALPLTLNPPLPPPLLAP